MKTKKLIKQLEDAIRNSILEGDDRDSVGLHEGVWLLISRSEAEKFLKLLKKERDSKRMVKKIMKEITCEECGEVLEFNEVGEKKCPRCEIYKKYRHDALMAFNIQYEFKEKDIY